MSRSSEPDKLDNMDSDRAESSHAESGHAESNQAPSNQAQSGGKSFMSGTFWVFLAEALIFPTGLVTAGILTRQLGQEGYGILTLVAVLVSWVEWTITSIFSRTTIKFVSDAKDWRPVGTVIAQLHVGIGAIATIILWIFAQPIADLLEIPTFVPYLRLFAIDIPIFCLAYAHRQLLVGRGLFRVRAIASAGRWTARLAIIAVLVEYANWSIEGAIIGSLGASVVELLIARWCVRPPLLQKSSFPPQRLFGYALPLFLFATSLRLFDKLDLFMLKILGGTVEQAGVYGAAQNLAFVPGIFALSFSPLLLSTLNRTLRSGEAGAFEQTKQIASNAVRTVIALVPFAALAAAASVPIVTVVYGQAFAVAGPVLAVLIFAAMALMMISVVTAILTAAGRPNLTAALVAPMLPLSAVGYMVFVPQHGAMAACWVNMGAAVVGALAALGALYKTWRILPGLMTVVRSAIACCIIYALGIVWITPDPSFIAKILILSAFIPIILLCLGELTRQERQFVSSLVMQQRWIKALRS